MGLLSRFMKNGGVDDEDGDDDEIADEEEDDEEEGDEEEAETGDGLFSKLRGLTGKLLGQGGDDDEDDDDVEDGSPAAAPSPPVQTVPTPSAEAEAAQRDLTASLEGASPEGIMPEGASSEGITPEGASSEGITPEGASPEGITPEGASSEGVSFEDPAPPSLDTQEDLPVNHKALTGLTEEELSEDSGGGPDHTGLTSEETTAEKDDSSKAGLNLGNIFDKKVEIDQNLRNLARSQEETPAEALATDLRSLFQELEEIMSK